MEKLMAGSVQESLAWLALLATFPFNLYQFSVSPVLIYPHSVTCHVLSLVQKHQLQL